MAESNSQPIRCPCGFFGSAQTLGLCSKCFREREENRDRTMLSSSDSSSRTQAGVVSSFEVSSSSNLMPQIPSQSSPISLCKNDFYATTTSNSPQSTSDADPRVSTETHPLPASPPEPIEDVAGRFQSEPPTDASDSVVKRGTKRKFEEDEEEDDPSARAPQKNKRRCYHCNMRLDLALQAIGRCKCDFVFCSLHRLPEQHNCNFDHKETSREEARSKMVVFKKHVGTALKRLDSDS